MLKNSEIRIRDPFVLLDNDRYYLYGTTDENPWEGKAQGFNAYVSEDLEHWEGPYCIFSAGNGFWADENFWGPEVYRYRGAYYMIASFIAPGVTRVCQVLKSEHPLGPFIPFPEPITPPEWRCLDGTLYLEQGKPWLVFCREWLEVNDGEVYAMPLKEDLSGAAGAPHFLFSASQAPWVNSICEDEHTHKKNYVTDAPFLHKMKDGSLLMIWSSFSNGGYTIGQVVSHTGILGRWTHSERLLFDRDGGSGMIFTDKEGKLRLSFHQPNQSPLERPVFLELAESEEGGLTIV